jgi:hypothetical protein
MTSVARRYRGSVIDPLGGDCQLVAENPILAAEGARQHPSGDTRHDIPFGECPRVFYHGLQAACAGRRSA